MKGGDCIFLKLTFKQLKVNHKTFVILCVEESHLFSLFWHALIINFCVHPGRSLLAKRPKLWKRTQLQMEQGTLHNQHNLQAAVWTLQPAMATVIRGQDMRCVHSGHLCQSPANLSNIYQTEIFLNK